MFLFAVFCVIASTAAMPALEYLSHPSALVLTIPELELHTNVPNIERSVEHKFDDEISIESRDKSNEEEKERTNIVPAIPSPPELPTFDPSILKSLLKTETSEDFHDGSEDIKPHYIEWKVPKIRYPGGYIINDVYGPRISLSA